ncbi:uncharacterized protein [Apostichopus japonicus]|uniref:uncharacterized protein n=1 Tax=Stichopus japonicus TaxID=307972 RepID=UPI003AB2E130
MAAYNHEPKRASNMTVNESRPFNAEPPISVLREHFVTPTDQFYIRNHAPVPVLNGSDHVVTVTGLVPLDLKLTMYQLEHDFPQATVMATLMCAGNRRTEMSKIKKVRGVPWGHAAISNAIWKGPRLQDVLLAAGVHRLESIWDTLHVEFEGVDICKDNRGYGSSIPMVKAMDPKGDTILALQMNGHQLPRDHGYPVRVIVPGYIGARSVKWLQTIRILSHESTNYFQVKDYKLFPPHVDWDVVDNWWDKAPPIQEMSVQAAICQPADGEAISPAGKYTVKGYALTGGGRRITRVDVSLDNGSSWETARLFSDLHNQKTGSHLTKWSWEFWELPVMSMPAPCTIICRAWDESCNTMPEDLKQIWNLRGVMNNSWVKINVRALSKV